MAESTTRDGLTRALVLGGGGSVGNAWEIGVLAGVAAAGVDVSGADLIVGTSAGATAAAQITGAAADTLFAATVSATLPATDRRPMPAGGVAGYLERTNQLIAAAADPADMRRRMGEAALALADVEATARWRAIVAPRLPRNAWPDQRVLITAVDARTGEPVVFDRDSGVELVDAVAASTSPAAAYCIGARRYIDGGYRRNENADLAAGHARVLVLSPFAGRTRHPLEWRMQLDAQVEELRAGGSAVETVYPDAQALAAFGDNMMDLASRAPSARAGYDQGLALADQLRVFWRGR